MNKTILINKSKLQTIAYVFSSFAFFMFWSQSILTACSLVVGFILSLIWKKYIDFEVKDRRIKFLSAISAVGILGGNCQFILRMNPAYADTIYPYVILIALIALYFLWLLLSLFYFRLWEILKPVFSSAKRSDLLMCTAVAVIACVVLTVFFADSTAFYKGLAFDVIYTSDSTVMCEDHVLANLASTENDIRQPLFAVFSMPFTGPLYFIGLPFSEKLQAILLGYSQIFLLIFAIYLLARTVKADSVPVFILFFASTYTFFLSGIMIEQYVTAFFYLMLFIYEYCEGRRNKELLIAASGTLITSSILCPVTAARKSFKEWFVENLKFLGCLLFLILASGRVDSIIGIGEHADWFGEFTSATFENKLMQFTVFIKNCFYRPQVQTIMMKDSLSSAESHISLQLADPYFEIIGIAILILFAVSAYIYRKETFTKFAVFWVALSALVLIGFGWGASENGFILYVLYFGWPYIAMLYKLMKKYIATAASVLLLVLNAPAITEMYAFAVTNY